MKLIYTRGLQRYIRGAVIRHHGACRMPLSTKISCTDEWGITYSPVPLMIETLILHSMLSYIRNKE